MDTGKILPENRSFDAMQKLLRAKGIENNNFMNTLLDKSLATVNPYDEDLDETTKEKIIKECRNNIWYLLRNVLRVNIPGEDSVQYMINPLTTAFFYLYTKNINAIMIGTRQISFKTHALYALEIFNILLGKNRFFCSYTSRYEDARRKFMMPSYIEPLLYPSPRDPKLHNVLDYLSDYGRLGKKDVIVVDDIMSSRFPDRYDYRLFVDSRRVEGFFGAATTIGKCNAQVVANSTMSFYDELYDKDLDAFTKAYHKTFEVCSCFTIHVKPSEFNILDDALFDKQIENFKQYIGNGRDTEEIMRHEIYCERRWSLY